MTIEKARKVIGLNIHNLDERMQMAVATIMDALEWSEEDKEMIERLIRHTQKEFNELCNDRYGHQEIISDLKESCRERMNWLENRLKSLCSHPKKSDNWKPSDEQMLKDAVEGKIEEVSFNNGELHNTIFFSFDEESLHVENRIWFPRCGKDGDKVKIVIVPIKEDK